MYYHQDHLGSTVAVTGPDGSKQESIYYDPFGATKEDVGSVSVSHKYTSQEQDAETGLYYYGARYYNPVLGRFISPDPIVPDYANPQALNRYSYVLNNPLFYTDPTGNYYDMGDFFFDDEDYDFGGGGYSSGGYGGGYSFPSYNGQYNYGLPNYSANSTMERVSAIRKMWDRLNFDDPNGLQYVNPAGPRSGLRTFDAQGYGYYGACRDSGCPRLHAGIDEWTIPGQEIYAPFDGVANAIYKNKVTQIYEGVGIAGEHHYAKILYVIPRFDIYLFSGRVRVQAGDVIGHALDITVRYRGITNHFHGELRRLHDGQSTNPYPFYYGGQ